MSEPTHMQGPIGFPGHEQALAEVGRHVAQMGLFTQEEVEEIVTETKEAHGTVKASAHEVGSEVTAETPTQDFQKGRDVFVEEECSGS